MESSEMTGTLFIVGTPIGNLGDMSPRAVETLQNADLIAAEDTRTAAMLLEKFGITGAKILPNHKFNEGNAAYGFVQDLLQGKTIALVTDAGMPCVSDPGYLLVEAAVAAGIKERLWPLVGTEIRPTIFRKFGLCDAAAAHEEMEKKKHIGKIVLKVLG